ncbi:uncharacterized protein ASPWEDRAFT_173328 [Neofusicoccum parvum]|nr:uncharacterized protein ASPWEDRAFT_173328 [Neofusicoccum parvum]
MATRSRGGCWTCKRRRRKCDEARPACATCRARGLRCEGYATRLRWGVGLASRGRLVGASEPVVPEEGARAKGRARDRLRGREKEGVDGGNGSGCDGSGRGDADRRVVEGTGEEERRLFDEFMTSGHKLLSSAHARDAPLRTIVSRHGHPSRALYHICLSFQALVSRAPHGAFLQHYAAALSKYRAEIAAAIADPGRADDADTDATLHAGLLMCTVGMLQAVPWTYHLAGLSRLLSLRAWPPSSSLASTHAVEVVALLDLPILVVGRLSPCLGLWQQLRKHQRTTPAADSIDVVTGLPRSLIDLLADEPAALDEAALRAWTPACGGDANAAQRCVWEAYRLAGMVQARGARRSPSPGPAEEEDEGALLARLVAAVGAVQASGDDVVAHDDALWPTFVAALEVARRPERRRRWAGVVAAWFERQVRLDRLNTSRLVWELLEEVRRRAVRGDCVSADDVARGWGVEIVLF